MAVIWRGGEPPSGGGYTQQQNEKEREHRDYSIAWHGLLVVLVGLSADLSALLSRILCVSCSLDRWESAFLQLNGNFKIATDVRS